MANTRYKFYNVLITLCKNNNVYPNLLVFKAESPEKAIEYAVKNKSIIDLLLDGYTIGSKNAREVPAIVCPHNANSVFAYTFSEDGAKIENLYIDFKICTPEFYEDLKQVLLKHWTKDTDKL